MTMSMIPFWKSTWISCWCASWDLFCICSSCVSVWDAFHRVHDHSLMRRSIHFLFSHHYLCKHGGPNAFFITWWETGGGAVGRTIWLCTVLVLCTWPPTPPDVLGFFAHDLAFLGRCSGAYISWCWIPCLYYYWFAAHTEHCLLVCTSVEGTRFFFVLCIVNPF